MTRVTLASARMATIYIYTHIHIYPRLPAVRWGKEEKGLDWPFKSHLGSENLACRERKELMSEDGWAARWGLMLMGELKLSTQTLRGQNCRSVFLMLTSPNTKVVNLPPLLSPAPSQFFCFLPFHYPFQ